MSILVALMMQKSRKKSILVAHMLYKSRKIFFDGKRSKMGIFLLVYSPDQPNLASLAICLAPGKKDPNRQRKLGKAFRRSFKGKKGLKWLGFT